jgi:hypothetical protein
MWNEIIQYCWFFFSKSALIVGIRDFVISASGFFSPSQNSAPHIPDSPSKIALQVAANSPKGFAVSILALRILNQTQLRHWQRRVVVDTAESWLTLLSHCWHRWVIVDTAVSLFTPPCHCWHRWVIVDTAVSLLTPQSHGWHRWVIVDTAVSLLTPPYHCWHRRVFMHTAESSLNTADHCWHCRVQIDTAD